MLNNVASHASQLSRTPLTARFQAILAARQSKQSLDKMEVQGADCENFLSFSLSVLKPTDGIISYSSVSRQKLVYV